jgi:tetratricopeptide (TPR) repeat protein
VLTLVFNAEHVISPTRPLDVSAFFNYYRMKIPFDRPSSFASIKVALVVVSLAGAFVAAVILKSTKQKNTMSTVMRRKSLPGEILAAIPVTCGKTASESAVREAVAKANSFPMKPQIWVALGDALAQRLRESNDQAYYGFAESVYQQAISLKPDCADAMNGMAWVEGGRHHFDQSIAWGTKVLTIAPDSADAFGILGDADVELGNYDLATDHYQKMMDLRPDLSSWSRGAYLLWITGKKVEANHLMEKAIRAGGAFAENTAWCRAKLAMMLIHDGAFVAAAKVLEPSLREQSRNPHVVLAAARLATATRETDVAQQYYRMLLESGPNHDAFVGLGDLQSDQGNSEEAEKFYRQVEELHAAHLATGVHDHVQIARFLADHDRNLVEALRLAEQHKLTRNVLEADVLAWVYYKNGDQPHAIEAIKLALSQQTPDAEIHYHAGMIAAMAGDRDSAERHLEAAIAMNPQFNLLQVAIARNTLAKLSGSKVSNNNQ